MSESFAKAKTPVLIVDDAAPNRELLAAFLRGTDFEATFAENGVEAIERFTQGTFAIVVMDMQMPILDGFAATQVIRTIESEQGRKPIPVVALTAHAVEEEIRRTLDSGCSLHIPKPIRRAQLLKTLESLRFETVAKVA